MLMTFRSEEEYWHEYRLRERAWRVWYRAYRCGLREIQPDHADKHFRLLTESEFAFIIQEEDTKMATAKKDGTPRKPRTPRASAAQIAEIESSFLNHLRFVSVCSNNSSEVYSQHCTIGNRRLIAFDGILTAGVMIEEDVTCCPHTETLLRALTRAGGKFAMTIDGPTLTVKADKFRANVPCVDPMTMQQSWPDPMQWPLNDEFREALKACSAFASDNAQTVVVASVLCLNGSCVGTDRIVMLQYAHGNPMPDLVVPRSFATAINRVEKPLKGFGYSQTSLTVFFEDDSFLKTQLYSEPWPENWETIMPANPMSLRDQRAFTPEFWEAYDAIKDFSDDDRIRSRDGRLQSHVSATSGASFELADWHWTWTAGVQRLKMVRPYAKTVGNIDDQRLGFFGDKCRGVIALNLDPAEMGETPAQTTYDPSPPVGMSWQAPQYSPTGEVPQQQYAEQPAGIADSYADAQAQAPSMDAWGAPAN